MIGELKDTNIKLKRIFIETQLSKELAPLNKLANNLWWSWNEEAIELFTSINPERFVELNYNPVALLKELDTETSERLVKDKEFLLKLKKLEKAFDAYVKVKPAAGSPRIAYFSMEYGLHISLKLYSGGLGVLAGDYLKLILISMIAAFPLSYYLMSRWLDNFAYRTTIGIGMFFFGAIVIILVFLLVAGALLLVF